MLSYNTSVLPSTWHTVDYPRNKSVIQWKNENKDNDTNKIVQDRNVNHQSEEQKHERNHSDPSVLLRKCTSSKS